MPGECQVSGCNPAALFTLKLHRGDGMTLAAMNWKVGRPPADFVGFAIEYREPGGDRFYALKNRMNFADAHGKVARKQKSTRLSPIQKFRWVHFPRNADLPGEFVYRVTPVFMNEQEELSYGEFQEARIVLARETYPGQLNVSFTRGFVSSQAFVERFAEKGPISTLLPARATEGLDFKPTHPESGAALRWMGFEARSVILALLDEAVADAQAQVRVVAYDLSEPEVVSRLRRLGDRLKIIIDDSGEHADPESGESVAADLLRASAGAAGVRRQHMGGLQHNKTIVVDGPGTKRVVCGSTNFSWRGFFVQANNALVLQGAGAVGPFLEAFENYWSKGPPEFGESASASWSDLGLSGIDARVAFSPHSRANALLESIAADIRDNVGSSLFFSLAFLYQTPGAILEAVKSAAGKEGVFSYGVSDRQVGGLELQKPDGGVATVYPAALSGKVPEPFKAEPVGGGGVRMHHKFIVIDFDKPTARVYLGSYNFSGAADRDNGENLVLIRDRRVAVSYAIEALRIFDHYHFRVKQKEWKDKKEALALRKPPRGGGENPWWLEDYTDPRKIRDRELFAATEG